MKRQINPEELLLTALEAVITVGDGRGFVVTTQGERVVVTAAHCLPHFPPCHGMSYLSERTYWKLLSPLGQEPSVSAKCLFADPIADIAILGSPDNQELAADADAYQTLVGPITPLKIAEAAENGRAWLLSLERQWFECTVEYMKHNDGPLLISKLAQSIVGGMSGSPIISENGKAIGGVCCASEGNMTMTCTLNPRLVRDFPSRFLHPKRHRWLAYGS